MVRARGRALRHRTGAQRQAARGGGRGRGRSGRRLQGQRSQAVVTNLEGEPDPLYDGLYCQRGEAENRIKEAQLDLFGTRASRSRFMANQFPLLLAALAYTLMQRLRALALQGTELERASAGPIRCACCSPPQPDDWPRSARSNSTSACPAC